MSTNITGNPAVGESPSPNPVDGTAPISAVPVSGDPVTAASVRQALGNPLDHIAFLKAPFAKANAWAQKIMPFMDARGRERFTVDHFGMPRFAGYDWTSLWTPGSAYTLAGIQDVQIDRWRVVMNAASCAAGRHEPGVSAGVNFSNIAPSIQLVVDGGASGNRSELRLANDSVTSLFHDDALFHCEFDVNPFTLNSMNWVTGFTSNGEFVNGINNGAYFVALGGGNWMCVVNNGGSPTVVDSGIAATANTPAHLDVAFLGANVSDDSAEHVLFFINGAAPIDITATIPIGSLAIPVVGGYATGSVANQALEIGPVHYSQITARATL